MLMPMNCIKNYFATSLMNNKRAAKRPKISIVIPAYNEQESLAILYKRLKEVLLGLEREHEIVMVDDGSSDGTFEEMKRLVRKDKRVKVMRLAKNFGQTAALSAGFEAAEGEIVVAMDADLQNDPRDIPKLLTKMDGGYDLVSGWRKKRQDKWLSRRLPSVMANWLIGKISGVPLHDFGCTLKAYKKELLSQINLYGEMHRFIPAVAAGQGARIAEVAVRHQRRKYGKSKYGLSRVVSVILDVLLLKFLLSFQSRPMRLFGGLGLIVAGVGTTIFGWLSYEKLVMLRPLSQRPLFQVSIFLILVGVQLVTIGILAEMMMRVYFESQNKKTYYVRERWQKGKK